MVKCYLHRDLESYVDECYTKVAYMRAYRGSIAPCMGKCHWLEVDMPKFLMIHLFIKIGPEWPKKTKKSPHEDSKKWEKYTRHGMQMNYSKSTWHNKKIVSWKRVKLLTQYHYHWREEEKD